MVPFQSDVAQVRCPRCDSRIEVRRFPPLLRLRRRPERCEGLCCPHCSCRLAWTRGPEQALLVGQWLFVAGIPLLCTGWLAGWSVVAFGAGGLTMALGMARQQLVVVEAEFTATIDLDDAEDAAAVRSLVTDALAARLSARAQDEHREAALAGRAGVAYDPGERWLRWDSVDVRCPAPVEEAARCAETGLVVALLVEGVARRLRVFDPGGVEAAAFEPPEGHSFYYLSTYPSVQPGVSVVCCQDAPTDGSHGDWHFRIDLKRGELVRHSAAR